jgi:hypothetical protein
LFGIPGIAGAASIPFVAHGEGAEGEFGDEDGAGRVEALDYGGVFVDGLMFESAGAPGSGVALHSKEIFGAPGESMEGTAVVATGDVGVGFARLVAGAVFGDGDAEVEDGVVAAEAGEVHVGEVGGGDFFAAEEVG